MRAKDALIGVLLIIIGICMAADGVTIEQRAATVGSAVALLLYMYRRERNGKGDVDE